MGHVLDHDSGRKRLDESGRCSACEPVYRRCGSYYQWRCNAEDVFLCLLSLPVVQILSGALRGAGKSSIPMFFMLSCFVVIRQIYLAITVPMTHNLLVVIAGWPLTWVLCAAGMTVYFFRADWMKNAEKLVQGQ